MIRSGRGSPSPLSSSCSARGDWPGVTSYALLRPATLTRIPRIATHGPARARKFPLPCRTPGAPSGPCFYISEPMNSYFPKNGISGPFVPFNNSFMP